MNRIWLNRFCRALILPALLLEFSASAELSFIFTNSTPAAVPRRASILFIQFDGLGYGDLSCNGQTKFQTPNIDQLAADGIRFTNYSISAAASPSHAALMLGKNPAHLRQRADMDIPLAADEMTVAQILKNSGYHTGLIGDWNLGDENSSGAPWKKGFDEFTGYLDYGDMNHFYTDFIFRYDPRTALDPAGATARFIGHETIYGNSSGKQEVYIPDLLTKAALNFVKMNLPDQLNHHRPFFLLLNYKIPNEKIEVPTDAPYSEEPWPQPEKNRVALIARLDGYVGQLREQLNEIGMTNNVVIFLAGGSVPKKSADTDPDFFHSNISTNDFRVPMIVNWSAKIPSGQVSGLKWSAQDFLPTAADIAFADSPTNSDGISVLPKLQGKN